MAVALTVLTLFCSDDVIDIIEVVEEEEDDEDEAMARTG